MKIKENFISDDVFQTAQFYGANPLSCGECAKLLAEIFSDVTPAEEI